MTNTGPVLSAPNASAGMHAQYIQAGQGVSGLGDYFGAGQTQLITGIPNEYLALGAGLMVVLMMMK